MYICVCMCIYIYIYVYVYTYICIPFAPGESHPSNIKHRLGSNSQISRCLLHKSAARAEVRIALAALYISY